MDGSCMGIWNNFCFSVTEKKNRKLLSILCFLPLTDLLKVVLFKAWLPWLCRLGTQWPRGARFMGGCHIGISRPWSCQEGFSTTASQASSSGLVPRMDAAFLRLQSSTFLRLFTGFFVMDVIWLLPSVKWTCRWHFHFFTTRDLDFAGLKFIQAQVMSTPQGLQNLPAPCVVVTVRSSFKGPDGWLSNVASGPLLRIPR